MEVDVHFVSLFRPEDVRGMPGKFFEIPDV